MSQETSAQSSMDQDHRCSSCSDVGCGTFCHVGAMEHEPGSLEWLPSLLRQHFFTPCRLHRDHKKCEVTHYCLTCGPSSAPLCAHCLPAHTGHQTLQVRRYVYCDVVRAADMANHIDVTGVQSYIINQAKVIFLNPRPNSKLAVPGAEDGCATCHRCLREGCTYCCLTCKVEAMVAGGELELPVFTVSSDSSEGLHMMPGSETEVEEQRVPLYGPLRHHRCGPSPTTPGAAAAAVQGLGLMARSGSARSSTDASDGAGSDCFPASAAALYCSRRKQVSPRRSPLI